MNERILRYVDGLFRGLPPEQRVLEIKEELLSNLCDKYDDLVGRGTSEDEAFAAAVAGIGDIGSLLSDMADTDSRRFDAAEHGVWETPRDPATEAGGEETPGDVCWETVAPRDRAARLSAALSSVLWTLTTFVYFILSFLTNRWDITWIIFLAASVLQQVIGSITRGRVMVGGMIWTTTAALYFILSFATGLWHLTWLIFLVAAAVQQVARLWRIWRDV